jgi:hypothetical protein
MDSIQISKSFRKAQTDSFFHLLDRNVVSPARKKFIGQAVAEPLLKKKPGISN